MGKLILNQGQNPNLQNLTYKTNGDMPKINLLDRARLWAVVEWE